MNATLDCPVCGYRDVPGDTCPNCDADLSSLRLLLTLPEIVNAPPLNSRKRNWLVTVLISLTALVSMVMGTLTGLAFNRNRLIAQNPSGDNFVNFDLAMLQEEPKLLDLEPEAPNIYEPINPELSVSNQRTLGNFIYTIRTGDTLNDISSIFNISLDELVVANPQLQNREDEIYAGEEIKIPVQITVSNLEFNQ